MPPWVTRPVSFDVPPTASTRSRALPPLRRLSVVQAVPVARPLVQLPRPWMYEDFTAWTAGSPLSEKAHCTSPPDGAPVRSGQVTCPDRAPAPEAESASATSAPTPTRP